jgi:hypothetical protein
MLSTLGVCLALASQSTEFADPVATGTVQSSAIREASGIAASRRNPGVLWVHNDSGDSNRVFALNPQGALLGTYTLSGASASDWEDIAVGPGPSSGTHYLYVADVGNNSGSRTTLTIWRVAEPSVSLSQRGAAQTLSGVTALRFRYPDRTYDCETLLSDPATGDLYVVTKFASTGASRVYRFPAPQSASSTTTLQHVATVQFGSSSQDSSYRAATAGDISPSGTEILICTYQQAFLWRRTPGGSVASAFSTARVAVPYSAGGEAIGFSASGDGYYSIKEGTSPRIWFCRREGGAVTASFQNGVSPSASYAGSKDTRIAEAAPAATAGSAVVLGADGDDPNGSGRDVSALLQWNVTSIPRGSTVQAASITLDVVDPSGEGYGLYGLRRAWSESQATWTSASSGVAWATAGAKGSADRSSTLLGTLSATSTGLRTLTLNSSGIAQVQSWVNDPATNFGLIVAGAGAGDGVDFNSREFGTASRRPKLTVAYVPASGSTLLASAAPEEGMDPADGLADGELGAPAESAGEAGEPRCGATGAETLLLLGAVLAWRYRRRGR